MLKARKSLAEDDNDAMYIFDSSDTELPQIVTNNPATALPPSSPAGISGPIVGSIQLPGSMASLSARTANPPQGIQSRQLQLADKLKKAHKDFVAHAVEEEKKKQQAVHHNLEAQVVAREKLHWRTHAASLQNVVDNLTYDISTLIDQVELGKKESKEQAEIISRLQRNIRTTQYQISDLRCNNCGDAVDNGDPAWVLNRCGALRCEGCNWISSREVHPDLQEQGIHKVSELRCSKAYCNFNERDTTKLLDLNCGHPICYTCCMYQSKDSGPEQQWLYECKVCSIIVPYQTALASPRLEHDPLGARLEAPFMTYTNPNP